MEDPAPKSSEKLNERKRRKGEEDDEELNALIDEGGIIKKPPIRQRNADFHEAPDRSKLMLILAGGLLALGGLALVLFGLGDFLSVDGSTKAQPAAKQPLPQPTNKPEESKRPKPTKPNILLITTDQQRFDAIRRVQDELEHYNNVTKIRTPNLDKLSRDGVYFQNAYTQCSVCGPARASLRSGCTIERTGLQTNHLLTTHGKHPWFHKRVEELTVIDQVLTENGYSSEYYGKWHLPDKFLEYVRYNNYNHWKEAFTLEDRVIAQKYRAFLDLCEDLGEVLTSLEDGMQIDKTYHFPYTPIELDSRYGSPTGTDLTEENGFASWEVGQDSSCGEASFKHNYSESHFIADAASRALERLLEEDDPFFLTVSFNAPHPPVIATSKYWEYYKDEKENLYVAPSLYDTLENSGYDHIAKHEPKYQNHKIVQEWTSLYYAVIEEIDDLIGDLLAQLGDRKDDTLIVFTSDHGEMLGSHGKRGKNSFYEESNKIPLFMSFPGVIEPGSTVEEMVSHIDIVATILDYVGLSSHDKSDGTSLRSKIEKQSFNEEYDEDVVIAEWDYRDPQETEKTFSFDQKLDVFLSFMVRKGPYKLMLRKEAKSKKMDMMFNLDQDPFEMNNVLGSNADNLSHEYQEKAEHLRCLLLDWMHRMDGGEKKYYSDPIANGGEGLGDIEEVRLRQSWPALDFWKSDSTIQMGPPVWNGTHYVRNEYLYFGRRSPGQGLVNGIRVLDKNADFFYLELANGYSLDKLDLFEKECVRMKVSFVAEKLELDEYTAAIELKVSNASGGEEEATHSVAVHLNTREYI